jgi:predicted dehydrogenase
VPNACADFEELAAHPEVDLVVVTVKVPQHERLVGAALAAGKAVLCEWPLGNGTAEAERMAEAARERGLRGFVGLQARSAPAVRHVRGLVADGVVGEVLGTTVVGSGGQWGATIDGPSTYLLDEANGATMLTIPFGHTLDGVCFALGEIDQITATTATRRSFLRHRDTGEPVPMTASDQVAVTGVLDCGAVAVFHYRGGTTAATNFRWEINGTEGDIVVEGSTGHLQYGQVDIRVSRDGGPLRPSCPPEPLAPVGVDPTSPAYSLAQAYSALADDLHDGGSRIPTFDDAVRRHRALDRIRAAAGTSS